ncbi:DUF4362 domain-containing protein [Saccharibacillus qingshengii]|uniref:DUF4362 domain-containing protein n=1 Tax=Saccharibacillus qingshengii TaxID=1763540 RepID=UPI0015552522|nr:DUF4362 domain-containing protein [Saccharibacillus qingshengii]
MSIWIKCVFAGLLLLTLGACSPEEAKPPEPVSSPFDRMPDTIPIQPVKSLEPAGEQVITYRYIPFGELREFVTFTQPEEVEAFRHAVKTAKPDPFKGDRNQAKADFGVRLEMDGIEKTYLLWLENAGQGEGLIEDLNDRGSRFILGAKPRKDLYDRIHNVRYDSERAEKNGDIVPMFGKVAHMSTWKAFVENVEHKRPDSVQFTSYTIEGDPIFDNLSYDGRSIHYVYDNSYEKFGLSDKASYTCQKITAQPLAIKRGGPGTLYRLGGCTGTGDSSHAEEEQFGFPIPDKTAKRNPESVTVARNSH